MSILRLNDLHMLDIPQRCVDMARRILDDVERNVDRTDSKLNSAMRKMKKFVRDTEGILEPVPRHRRCADTCTHPQTPSRDGA